MAFAARYDVLAPLGRGGMGRVYRARDLLLEREVALKLLDSGAGDELAARFQREARAIARLDHPGCVRILDFGARHIVMELVSGATLRQVLQEQGALPIARAVRIARGVVTALAHAHARGVLHRDIKPENVMVSGGRVVLIDFGLACLHDEPGLTGAGMCLGSPSYLAPERLRGEPYDARADLYAAGVVLYEMLAGERPFPGESLEETMTLALRRPARPLRALRPELPRALDAIVARALAKRPARRFADADEMCSALDAIALDAAALDAATPPPAAARGEASATSTIALLSIRAGSPLARLWGWLRYGRWRWRRRHA